MAASNSRHTTARGETGGESLADSGLGRALRSLLLLTVPLSSGAVDNIAQKATSSGKPQAAAPAPAPPPRIIKQQADFVVTAVHADGDFLRRLEIKFLDPEQGRKQFLRDGDSNAWTVTHTAGGTTRKTAHYGTIAIKHGCLWNRLAPGVGQPSEGPWIMWELPEPQPTGGAGSAQPADASKKAAPAAAVHPLMALSAQDARGLERPLADFLPEPAGRIIVVHLGAPWCTPCAPDLAAVKAQAAQRPGKVEVATIDIETPDAPITLPQDDRGVHLKVSAQAAAKIGVKRIPCNFIISDGRVLPLEANETRGEEFLKRLDRETQSR